MPLTGQAGSRSLDAAVEYLPPLFDFEKLFEQDLSYLLVYLSAGVAGFFGALIAGAWLLRRGHRARKGFAERFPRVHLRVPLLLGSCVCVAVLCSVNVESIHNMEAAYLHNFITTSFLDNLAKGALTSHLPAYVATVRLISLVSTELIAFRAFSALAMLLAVVCFYNLARMFYDRRATLLATLLFSLAPVSLYYAKVAEPYSLLLAVSTLFTWLFMVHIRHPKTSSLPLIVCGVLGCYLHVYFTAALAAAVVTVLLAVDRWRRFREFSTALGGIVMLSAPVMLLVMLQKPLGSVLWPPQVAARVHLPHDIHPQVSCLRDYWLFFGFQINLSSVALAYIAGAIVVLAFLATVWMARRVARDRTPLLMALSAVIFCLLLNVFLYDGINRGVAGWYPLWRHSIVIVPFVFFALAALISRCLSRLTPAVTYVLVGVVLLSQVWSARRILFDTNIPDSRGAWHYVSERLQDGDAISATPVTLFCFSTFSYHVMPERLWKEDELYWHELEPGKKTFLDFNNHDATYTSMANIYLVKRIWNLNFDFRFFGLVPEFNQYGQELFDRAFHDWRVADRRSFPFVTVRLLEAPAVPPMDRDTLKIEAGRNDLKFARGMGPEVFEHAEIRTISRSGQIFAPRHRSRKVPRRMRIDGPGYSLEVKLDETMMASEAGGHLISLEFAAGRSYREITVEYE